VLAAGTEIVRAASRTWRIPIAVADTKPGESGQWSQEMMDLALGLLSPAREVKGLNSDGNSGKS
jgi:hypothetical protein